MVESREDCEVVGGEDVAVIVSLMLRLLQHDVVARDLKTSVIHSFLSCIRPISKVMG